MTCNNTCIHYPVCEQKNWDFANIDECPHYCIKPERQKGEWILIKNSDGVLKCYECSECKKCQGYISNFCEDCGADMRKEGEQDA